MSQFISLDQAKKMTALYRSLREELLVESERGKNILPVCETLERENLDVLLAQPGCKGIRIYYGMDPEKRVHSVIVGVDETGTDIIPQNLLQSEADQDSGNILDELKRCPEECPPPSPLYP